MVDQVRTIGSQPEVVAETVRRARVPVEGRLGDLRERRSGSRRSWRGTALHKLIGDPQRAGEMADRQGRIRVAEQRATTMRDEIATLEKDLIDEAEVITALASFGPVWDSLSPREQARLIQLLVERVDYDGAKGTVSVTFRPRGIKQLAQPKEIAV